MANRYYLLTADKVEQACALAPTEGRQNQLFGVRYSDDGSKAIVQADWPQEALPWLDENGVYLGDLQPDGAAPAAVYDELAKEEWDGIV